jgi:ribosomal protein S18 acetylase RimI-like enzyme
MHVRELRWQDFDDIRETYYRFYDERDRGVPIGLHLLETRPSLTEEADWFVKTFRSVLDGERIVSVAEVDGRVVGHCSIWRAAPATAENGHVGILGIVVDERCRGQGVGTALLRDALDRARGKFEVVRLSVFATNERAQKLYRRFGFVDCGRIPRAIRRGATYIDEIEMVLVLAPPTPVTGKH